MPRKKQRPRKRKDSNPSARKSAAARPEVPAPAAQSQPRSTPSHQATGIIWPVIPHPLEAYALALQFQLEETQWWPAEKLLAHQLRQVQVLIDHAAATVPFYRDRLEPFAGRPPGELTLERFRRIPLLTRQEIQQAGKDLTSRKLPEGHGPPVPNTTSGSSGRPMEFLTTVITSLMVSALTMRGHLWHKRDLGQKNMTLRRVRRDMPFGRHGRWAPLPRTGPNLVIDVRLPISQIFEQVIAEDPVYLQAYTYIILGLLQRSEETGVRPRKLREVRTFGETLDPWLREKCREIWGVPIVDNYSAEEFGTIAHQCPDSTNLHVQAESVLVEVLDEAGEPCRPGGTGRVVATSLNNFATPFIREELGDIVRLGPPCACGRGLPVLERILGREKKLVVLPTGEKVYPLFHDEFFAIPVIRQFQLTQKTLERIEVRLAVARPLTPDEESAIRGFLDVNFGYPFEVSFVYVDEIPREASRKYQDFRSEVLAGDAT